MRTKKTVTVEYATTHGDHYVDSRYDSGLDRTESAIEPDNPSTPEGTGWEMCGSAASKHRLYWFWKRTVKDKT